jgi:flavin reductase (DIM6/NTAB) family NADH-FMN oxidoreductase RutF
LEPVTAERFRTAMGRFATGVTVMTTRTDDGDPHGMTANAVSSVSLDPLLVLVCVERGAVMAEAVADSGGFALSILAADQRHLSDRFADPERPAGEAMFAGVGTSEAVTGAPLLDGATAALDCTVWASYEGGDHVIVVGEVQALVLGESEEALLYHRSGYGTAHGTPWWEEQAASEGQT